MKIVIVGFDGQLGVDCRKILGAEHQLICPTLAELNLCEHSTVTSFLTAHEPDVVINCAAYTAVDNCEKEIALCWQINSAGAGYLATACHALQSRLIHVSTDYVFDGRKEIPLAYTEKDAVNPLSQYGKSKLAGEEEVKKNCRDFIILRTAWLYSAHGPNFLKTMLRLTLSDPNAVRKVVNDQYGSLTWSHTLARQIEKLLSPAVQGIVHTTSDGHSTWFEASCYFLEKMGIKHSFIPCTTSEYPTPAHRPKNSILANTVLESNNLSVFVDWKKDVARYAADHGEQLLRELTAAQA